MYKVKFFIYLKQCFLMMLLFYVGGEATFLEQQKEFLSPHLRLSKPFWWTSTSSVALLQVCGHNLPASTSSKEALRSSHLFKNLSAQTLSKKHMKVNSASYVVQGVKYRPQKHYTYQQIGFSSHYGEGDVFHGRLTATGEKFDKNGLTAAHRTLPLPCVVKITNIDNGRMLYLKVNDRGPFIDTHKRIIDVSAQAAKLLGFYNQGIARVKVEAFSPERLNTETL